MSTEVTPHDILLLEEVSEMTRLPRATLRFYRHRGDGGPSPSNSATESATDAPMFSPGSNPSTTTRQGQRESE